MKPKEAQEFLSRTAVQVAVFPSKINNPPLLPPKTLCCCNPDSRLSASCALACRTAELGTDVNAASRGAMSRGREVARFRKEQRSKMLVKCATCHHRWSFLLLCHGSREVAERVGNRFGENFSFFWFQKDIREMKLEKAQEFHSRTAVQVAVLPSSICNQYFSTFARQPTKSNTNLLRQAQ